MFEVYTDEIPLTFVVEKRFVRSEAEGKSMNEKNRSFDYFKRHLILPACRELNSIRFTQFVKSYIGYIKYDPVLFICCIIETDCDHISIFKKTETSNVNRYLEVTDCEFSVFILRLFVEVYARYCDDQHEDFFINSIDNDFNGYVFEESPGDISFALRIIQANDLNRRSTIKPVCYFLKKMQKQRSWTFVLLLKHIAFSCPQYHNYLSLREHLESHITLDKFLLRHEDINKIVEASERGGNHLDSLVRDMKSSSRSSSTNNPNNSQSQTRSNWNDEEDKQLLRLRIKFGKKWTIIASNMEGRNGKQCSSRFEAIDPSINRGDFSEEEDGRIRQQVGLIGRKWSQIAKILGDRTANQVKNRWNGTLKKQ